jgi:hypothetical protein
VILRCDGAGSITILVQHGQPGDTSNWLPGARRALTALRIYQPQAAILDGTYNGPPITNSARRQAFEA